MHGGIGCLCAGKWPGSLRCSVVRLQFKRICTKHAILTTATVLSAFVVIPPTDKHSEIPGVFAIGLVRWRFIFANTVVFLTRIIVIFASAVILDSVVPSDSYSGCQPGRAVPQYQPFQLCSQSIQRSGPVKLQPGSRLTVRLRTDGHPAGISKPAHDQPIGGGSTSAIDAGAVIPQIFAFEHPDPLRGTPSAIHTQHHDSRDSIRLEPPAGGAAKHICAEPGAFFAGDLALVDAKAITGNAAASELHTQRLLGSATQFSRSEHADVVFARQ